MFWKVNKLTNIHIIFRKQCQCCEIVLFTQSRILPVLGKLSLADSASFFRPLSEECCTSRRSWRCWSSTTVWENGIVCWRESVLAEVSIDSSVLFCAYVDCLPYPSGELFFQFIEWLLIATWSLRADLRNWVVASFFFPLVKWAAPTRSASCWCSDFLVPNFLPVSPM